MEHDTATAAAPMNAVGRLAVLALVALGSCRTPTTPFPAADVPGMAPPPYTAEQIRRHHPDGSFVEFVNLAGGEVVARTRMEFADADTTGVTVRNLALDAEGAPLTEPSEARSTWAELRGHAYFRAEDTELQHALTTVPAGTFECWVYRVHTVDPASGDELVWVYHFAVDRPGPPVLLVTERAGAEVGRMELAVDGR